MFRPCLSVPAKQLFGVEEPEVSPFQMRPLWFCPLQCGSRFSVPSCLGKNSVLNEHDSFSALIEASLEQIVIVMR